MRIKNIFFALIFVITFCGSFIYKPRMIVYPVVTILSMVQYPFLCMHALFIQPLADAITSLKTHAEYHRILESYSTERSRLLNELIEARGTLSYYKDLSDAGIKLDKNSVCIARVIYKQLHQPDSFFILDKGTSSGVAIDMVVVLNNVLLGRVTSVFHGYAHVMPISNWQCHVPIVCTQSHAHGVFRGNVPSYGQLDFISHLEPLVNDEMILTSGDGLVYPQGLAVGRIQNFTLNELGFLYQVDVKPLYDLEKITYCSVLTKHTQNALIEQVINQQ